MTAEQLRSLIAAGLPCEHLDVSGDGRHWYATVGQRLHTDEVHALSMKTLTPAEWRAQAESARG